MTALTLSLADIGRVIEEMHDAVDKWHNIGIQLNLYEGDLKSIESNYPHQADRLREMICKWLKSGDATWNAMVNALKSRTVGESHLAEKLSVKYCKPIKTHISMETSERTESKFYDKAIVHLGGSTPIREHSLLTVITAGTHLSPAGTHLSCTRNASTLRFNFS